MCSFLFIIDFACVAASFVDVWINLQTVATRKLVCVERFTGLVCCVHVHIAVSIIDMA